MRRARFLAPLLLFVPAFAGMLWGGLHAWVIPVVTFVVIPLAELMLPGSTSNLSPAEEQAALADPWYDWLVYAVVPLQVALLLAYLTTVAGGHLSGLDLVGATLTMGIACGTYGINVAHELGHRREELPRSLARILLATTLYQHFAIEHYRGHHRRVATPDDPASSRRGETVYAFWWRSITGSYRSAWAIENERVAREGGPMLTWNHEMVRLTTYQVVCVAMVAVVFGPTALLAWFGVSLGGALLLETVNYIEHYGLQRALTERGTYERVRPVHSWNANHELGRMFLFELTRHSDHHAHSSRPYQVLRHIDHAPQLPTGYPGLIMLALVPPLFFAVMDPALDDWQGGPSAAMA